MVLPLRFEIWQEGFHSWGKKGKGSFSVEFSHSESGGRVFYLQGLKKTELDMSAVWRRRLAEETPASCSGSLLL
ncbi:hypothetical protein CHARACLAT_014564 [Characodon lateralis]|uniref:Uncharacterized protein n=1 Tax=Characodon lateralis TaxID=208331 RepID=A0ABU7EMN8_9TELE|nr:hypothetical protein [Characodon lateralis]